MQGRRFFLLKLLGLVLLFNYPSRVKINRHVEFDEIDKNSLSS